MSLINLALNNPITDLTVVWYGVCWNQSNKLKDFVLNNEYASNLEEDKKHKRTSHHIGLTDENLLKIVSRNVVINSKTKMKILEKQKHGTALLDEDKDLVLDKFQGTAIFNNQPKFKEVINRVLERIQTSSMISLTSQRSFDSSELNYHHISLVNRDSSLVSTLLSEDYGKNEQVLTRGTLLSNHLHQIIPDMKDSIPAEELLNMYVTEYHLNKPFSSTEKEHVELYINVIKKNKSLFDMLQKHTDMFPKDLIHVIQNFKKNISDSDENTKIVDNYEKDLYFYSSLTKSYPSFIDEITEDLTDLSVFYYPLFKATFGIIQSVDYLSEIEDEEFFRREIYRLNLELKNNRNRPDSLVRWKVMEFVKSCEHNYSLTMAMVQTCGTWLNNLMKCLFSEFSSIREETCIALAYIMSRQTITSELLNSRQYDVSYDIFVSILRVIEQYPENISSLYCLIGYILQKSVSIEILDFLIDRGPALKNPFMRKRWPKLIYYGLKYWPRGRMLENAATLRKIKESLELMALKTVTKKFARMTLYFLSRKYLLMSQMGTVWFDVDVATGKLLSLQSSKGAI